MPPLDKPFNAYEFTPHGPQSWHKLSNACDCGQCNPSQYDQDTLTGKDIIPHSKGGAPRKYADIAHLDSVEYNRESARRRTADFRRRMKEKNESAGARIDLRYSEFMLIPAPALDPTNPMTKDCLGLLAQYNEGIQWRDAAIARFREELVRADAYCLDLKKRYETLIALYRNGN